MKQTEITFSRKLPITCRTREYTHSPHTYTCTDNNRHARARESGGDNMRSRLASRGGAGADDDDDAEAAAAAAPLKLLRPWRRCCCCCANLLLLLLLPLPLPLPLLTSPAVDHRLRCCRRGFEGSRGRDGTRRGYSKSCEASTALRPRCLTELRKMAMAIVAADR